jgi:DNA-binding protein Fis
MDLQKVLDEVERELIRGSLDRVRGNQLRAAQLLGVPRTTLRDKMARHGLLTEESAIRQRQ